MKDCYVMAYFEDNHSKKVEVREYPRTDTFAVMVIADGTYFTWKYINSEIYLSLENRALSGGADFGSYLHSGYPSFQLR